MTHAELAGKMASLVATLEDARTFLSNLAMIEDPRTTSGLAYPAARIYAEAVEDARLLVDACGRFTWGVARIGGNP